MLQLANPNISKIDLYIPVVNDANTENLQYIEKHVGAERHSAKRDIWDTDWTFTIPQQYVQGQYIFLKLESISTLRLKERALTRNVDYYRDLSLTDELTGLYNRRYLKKKMQHEISRAVQEDKSLALIVMDIDFFKKYNDTYGHWQGDQVLIRFSEVLLNILDGTQMAFRFGGEEFVILLPNAFYDDSAAIAERIRSDFAAEEFVPVANSLVHVTISGGLSILKLSDTEGTLFERADKALYQAKASGRNRVVFL